MRTFRLTENELRPGCRQIEIEGDLDLAVADRLREAIDASSGYSQVLIDLERCEFLDSTGIAVIVQAYREMADSGRKLAICAPTGQVLRVLAVTGLTGNGLVFQTADEAKDASGLLASG